MLEHVDWSEISSVFVLVTVLKSCSFDLFVLARKEKEWCRWHSLLYEECWRWRLIRTIEDNSYRDISERRRKSKSIFWTNNQLVFLPDLICIWLERIQFTCAFVYNVFKVYRQICTWIVFRFFIRGCFWWYMYHFHQKDKRDALSRYHCEFSSER